MPPKPRLTHFLCLPITTNVSKPLIESGLERLRLEVLKKPQMTFLSNAIRPAGTLHLTIGMMSLTQPEKVIEAVKKLENLDLNSLLRDAERETNNPKNSANLDDSKVPELGKSARILDTEAGPEGSISAPSAIRISLGAISSMHSINQTSVLYVDPLDKSNRLYKFCHQLKSEFDKAGLLVDERRPLKLHVTVLNSIYAAGKSMPRAMDGGKRESQEGKTEFFERRRRSKPIKFDAGDLLEAMKEQEFVEVEFRLDKVAICKMGAEALLNDAGEAVDQRYEEIACRVLPE